MKRIAVFALATLCLSLSLGAQPELGFSTVFKGRDKFDQLVRLAAEENWKSLPIADRAASVGRNLVGTPYKSFTLEIDDHVEAPSVNLTGLDCWTFFETSLAFARMLDEPREEWTPQTMLHFVEMDRYRGGHCTGSYLSRLHYLEDWLHDNDQRGLVSDLTRGLGGSRVAHAADEMTINWRGYRYMRANPDLRSGIHAMEERVSEIPLYQVPKRRVSSVESKLRSGDIIGITTIDRGGIGTSHVGMAYRDDRGVVHFMHASSNHGKVIIDTRLSDYLSKHSDDTGIIVARPVR